MKDDGDFRRELENSLRERLKEERPWRRSKKSGRHMDIDMKGFVLPCGCPPTIATQVRIGEAWEDFILMPGPPCPVSQVIRIKRNSGEVIHLRCGRTVANLTIESLSKVGIQSRIKAESFVAECNPALLIVRMLADSATAKYLQSHSNELIILPPELLDEMRKKIRQNLRADSEIDLLQSLDNGAKIWLGPPTILGEGEYAFAYTIVPKEFLEFMPESEPPKISILFGCNPVRPR